MFLIKPSLTIKNSKLICTINNRNINGLINITRSYSTTNDVVVDEDEAKDKKSHKQMRKEEEIRKAKEQEENKVYGASSLSLVSSAEKVETKKVNQRRLLKPKNPREPREFLAHKKFLPLSLTEQQQKLNINREDLKQQIDSNKINNIDTFVIDLRSPKEFYADLPIKVSQNIPMEYPKIVREINTHSQKRGKKTKVAETKKVYDADMELNFWQKALKLTSLQWKEKYGFEKVKPTDNIIFYSANNGRGSQVAEMAHKSGFPNAKFLLGGIRQWNKHNSQ
ncbi:hypothetical protein DDB_G0277009 [Dictyostelium discoideum AX4]|uniref:Rhodanese domain-containing protein n=1 Tax=Dictyostelium discoideum TaxID=44689 RepID=Q550W5_DICDI|nr:hypothetical protein DDB_G0277009 [Dictyostelium discoideum AX4]EAL69006.1 hypothetical protein DDB_G0277009 [Dictyostelium discoideum AX4]|eukprot:XP_642817.1 hypothetical protein DDB_G0277009 [Dictyostelium discoideum AX4]